MTGRFLSLDPALSFDRATRSPQAWNLYSYVAGNPLRYADPLGLLRLECTSTGCTAIDEIDAVDDPWASFNEHHAGFALHLSRSPARRKAFVFSEASGQSLLSSLRSYYDERFELNAVEDNVTAAVIDYVALELVLPRDATDAGVQLAFAFIPEAKLAQKAGALIRGSLKASRSYRSELADLTYREILRLAAEKGPTSQAARAMKKLIENTERLLEKTKGRLR